MSGRGRWALSDEPATDGRLPLAESVALGASELVTRTTVAQGLDLYVRDDTVLARIAAIVGSGCQAAVAKLTTTSATAPTAPSSIRSRRP